MMNTPLAVLLILMACGHAVTHGRQIDLSKYGNSEKTYHSESTQIAFSVARTTPMDTGNNAATMTFDKVLLNHGEGFDNHSSHFYAPQPGNYIFMFTTRSTSSGKDTEIVLYHNGEATVKAYARTGSYMGSNQVVLTLEMGDSIWLDLQPDNTADSNDLHLTSFSGHFIQEDESHQPVPAFTAVKNVPLVNTGNEMTIPFDQIVTNTGQAFQGNSYFVAPVNGDYVFMVSCTGYSGTEFLDTTVFLIHQGNKTVTPRVVYSSTASMRIIIPLKATERVWVNIQADGAIKEATFAGYLLHKNSNSINSPLHLAADPVTFAVGRGSKFESGGTPITVLFDTLFTNVGLGFNITSSHFHAPVNGIYGFMFSALAFPKRHTIHLKHNGQIISGTTSEGIGFHSANQVILSLSAFDNVWIELQPNGDMGHNEDRLYNTFSGYLIFGDL